MREVKFRAWNKTKKLMIHSESINYLIHFDGTVNSMTDNGIIVGSYFNEHIVLMQYTGLKDKNGDEVYEGDIVRCTSNCPHEVIFKLDHGGNVLGGMPTFYLSGLKEGYQWTGIEEIIGNIYETPSILADL